ncbi:glycosyltransferase family 4 protein [Parafannyhessea umbonata]|uniref:glycosyltransferase family 4 protein n=1 Tax=Parafannyhessea umbonata TaxID=604330 RepID=UPI0026EA68A9|nr:glycosyltransferase family 4 protein [Parafannyhessea umbonata]MDD7199470.1 glycosyltransferase family 4 protein [Parafannyhessea umbonata]
MRIILVNKFHYLKGGSETYYFGLAEGLKKLGHEVHFFAMQDEKNLPCDDADLFVSAKDYNGATSAAKKISEAKPLIYSKESLEKFEKLCKRVHPDIVHMNLVHRQITLSILDAPYLKEHHVPVLFTSHDYILVCPNYLMLDGSGNVCDACLGGHFKECLKRKCVKESTAKSTLAMMEADWYKRHKTYSKIDRIIAPSEFMRKKLLEGGFPEKQVVTMQNFVSEDLLDRAHKTEDGTDRDKPYFLFFGRLSKEKGIKTLIDAFKLALPQLPEGMRLVIAGDGPERAELEPAAGKNVEFVGFKQGEELRKLVSGAAFACCPSEWRENMPYSIVEAFAAGTPVIGTNIGGIPELVEDSVTGMLCEPGDAESLAEALVHAANCFKEKEAYSALQERCRAYVLDHCGQSKYMGRLTKLYADLISLKKEF